MKTSCTYGIVTSQAQRKDHGPGYYHTPAGGMSVEDEEAYGVLNKFVDGFFLLGGLRGKVTTFSMRMAI